MRDGHHRDCISLTALPECTPGTTSSSTPDPVAATPFGKSVSPHHGFLSAADPAKLTACQPSKDFASTTQASDMVSQPVWEWLAVRLFPGLTCLSCLGIPSTEESRPVKLIKAPPPGAPRNLLGIAGRQDHPPQLMAPEAPALPVEARRRPLDASGASPLSSKASCPCQAE